MSLWLSENASAHLTAADVEAGVIASMAGNDVSDVVVTVEQSLLVDVSTYSALAPEQLHEPMREIFCPGNPSRCRVVDSPATSGQRRALSASAVSFSVTRLLEGNDTLAAPAADSGMLLSHLSHVNTSDITLISTVLGNIARLVATHITSSGSLAALLDRATSLPSRLTSILNIQRNGIRFVDLPRAMLIPMPPLTPPPQPTLVVPPAQSPTPQAGQGGSPSPPRNNVPPAVPPTAVPNIASAAGSTAQTGSTNTASNVYVVVGVVVGFLLCVAVAVFMYRTRAKANKAARASKTDPTVWTSNEGLDSSSAATSGVTLMDMNVPAINDSVSPETKLDEVTVQVTEPSDQPEPVSERKTLSSTGKAALERARARRSGQLKRTSSWGRMAVRRSSSSQPKETGQQSSTRASKDSLQLPSTRAVEGLEKQISGEPKMLIPKAQNARAPCGTPTSTSTLLGAASAAAPQSETTASPSDSVSPVEAESAPASTPASTAALTERLDALREHVDVKKSKARSLGLVLSRSAGNLPECVTTAGGSCKDDDLRRSNSEPRSPKLFAAVSDSLAPLQLPKSLCASGAPAGAPSAALSAAPAAPSAASAAPAASEAPLQRKLSLTQQRARNFEQKVVAADQNKPTRVQPLLVDGRRPQQSESLQVPRLSLDEQSWPPASAPAARSAIKESSLDVDFL